MGEPTKEQRARAVEILGATGDCAKAFYEGDWSLCSCNGASYPARDKARAALVYASLERESEHRVRTAVIAELRGLVSRAHRQDVGMPLVVDADSLENLIDELEAQNG